MNTSKKGGEMYSVDRHGRKVDAHLHEPILDNPEVDAKRDANYMELLKNIGMSEKTRNLVQKAIGNKHLEGFARGGTPHPGGMIKSAIPGRTDKIPLNVPAGSYILPADIPSALGQGNTEAGNQILTKMFKAGPYGSGMTGGIKPARPYVPRWNWMHYPRPPIMGRTSLPPRSRTFAEGGETDDHVPIIAAGGEYVIPPETVKEVGHGNIDAGHKVLDKFVLSVRKKHIDTLKKLKPPKK